MNLKCCFSHQTQKDYKSAERFYAHCYGKRTKENTFLQQGKKLSKTKRRIGKEMRTLIDPLDAEFYQYNWIVSLDILVSFQ